MSHYIIEKSVNLCGNVNISGSKNSSLPLIAGTILTDDICRIDGVPNLSDTGYMADIIESLGGCVKKEKEQAMLELKNEIGDLVIKTASKVIRQELTSNDQQKKIIEDSLKDLSN